MTWKPNSTLIRLLRERLIYAQGHVRLIEGALNALEQKQKAKPKRRKKR